MSKPQEPHAYPNPERLKYYQDDYRKFHTAQPKKLSGKLKVEQINIIVGLVAGLMSERATGFKPRLLDYGSGKGYQYLLARIHENWGGHLPICYDPGVIQLATRPPGRFDGIICYAPWLLTGYQFWNLYLHWSFVGGSYLFRPIY